MSCPLISVVSVTWVFSRSRSLAFCPTSTLGGPVVFCRGGLPLDCVGPRHRAHIRTHGTAPIRHPGDAPLRRAAPARGWCNGHSKNITHSNFLD
jgi:hypothetical protein